MAVYVDPLVEYANVRGEAGRYGSLWCHLMADTREELHAFAASIGMSRRWFQDDPFLFHYDLTPSRRARAVAAGAVEQDTRSILARFRERRLNA